MRKVASLRWLFLLIALSAFLYCLKGVTARKLAVGLGCGAVWAALSRWKAVSMDGGIRPRHGRFRASY